MALWGSGVRVPSAPPNPYERSFCALTRQFLVEPAQHNPTLLSKTEHPNAGAGLLTSWKTLEPILAFVRLNDAGFPLTHFPRGRILPSAGPDP